MRAAADESIASVEGQADGRRETNDFDLQLFDLARENKFISTAVDFKQAGRRPGKGAAIIK